MSRHLVRFAAFGMTLVACAGCAFMDPYERVGMWRPRNANDGNLTAMVADPHDLVVGKSDRVVDASLATAAVDRMRRGTIKPLPAENFEIGGSSGASTSAATPTDNGVY